MIALLLITQVLGDWPMWAGDLAHRALQLEKGAMVSTPITKWSVGGFYSEWQFSAIADVDTDGETEVVFGTFNDSLWCLKGSDGTIKWKARVGNSNIYSSPAVADVDGDGIMEVVVGNYDGNLYCVSGVDGTQEWSFATKFSIFSSPAVADVDGDGAMEVVIGSRDSMVYCISGMHGTQEWSYKTAGEVWASPAVGDVDGDGQSEVIIKSRGNGGVLYCLNGATGALKWKVDSIGGSSSSPGIADLDGNGTTEVVATGNGVWAFAGSDGTQIWHFLTPKGVQPSPAIADVDDDSVLEVVVGCNDSSVYCIDGATGTQEWLYYSAKDHINVPGSLADIDGDGRLEYLVPGYNNVFGNGLLECLNAEDGSLLWTRGLPWDVHQPIVGDIDDDGCAEIVEVSYQSGAWALDDVNDSSGCGALYSNVDETNGSAALDFRVMGKGLYLFVSNQTQISLELYDASGRLVQELYKGIVPAGGHTFVPKLKNRGIYLVIMRYPGGTKTLKLVS